MEAARGTTGCAPLRVPAECWPSCSRRAAHHATQGPNKGAIGVADRASVPRCWGRFLRPLRRRRARGEHYRQMLALRRLLRPTLRRRAEEEWRERWRFVTREAGPDGCSHARRGSWSARADRVNEDPSGQRAPQFVYLTWNDPLPTSLIAVQGWGSARGPKARDELGLFDDESL